VVRAPTPFAFHSGVRAVDDDLWRVVDSGASAHFTGERTLFIGAITPTILNISGVAGGVVATGMGKGRVVISGITFPLPRLYFVPGLETSLISMSELVEEGNTISTQKVGGVHTMHIINSAGHIAIIHPTAGLYSCSPRTQTHPIPSALLALDGVEVGRTHVGSLSLGDLLHRRLGHHSWSSKLYADRIRQATGKKHLGVGCSVASCDACARTRMRQQYSKAAPTRPATRPLERVHFDFVPSIPVLGTGGYTGLVLLVDEKTSMLFPYPIRSKSELPDILATFKQEAERHFRLRLGKLLWPVELASLRSDGEAVNVSKAIREWCTKHGIIQDVSAPYCQWQNGRVERTIQTVWQ